MSAQEQFDVESSQSPLETTWMEAYERMCDVAPLEEQCVIVEITSNFQDPDLIAEFRMKHRSHLVPESIFFLEMSEAAKRANIEQNKQKF